MKAAATNPGETPITPAKDGTTAISPRVEGGGGPPKYHKKVAPSFQLARDIGAARSDSLNLFTRT